MTLNIPPTIIMMTLENQLAFSSCIHCSRRFVFHKVNENLINFNPNVIMSVLLYGNNSEIVNRTIKIHHHCVRACVRVCMCVSVCVGMCMCGYVYVCEYARMHVYTCVWVGAEALF